MQFSTLAVPAAAGSAFMGRFNDTSPIGFFELGQVTSERCKFQGSASSFLKLYPMKQVLSRVFLFSMNRNLSPFEKL
jgi:predicted transglutaminase-like cysteine proteinase